VRFITNAREQLGKEKNISPAFKSAVELLITVCQILLSRFIRKTLKNSGLPPAMDPNREKSSRAKKKRKPSGQPGHEGNTLQPVDHPDELNNHRLKAVGFLAAESRLEAKASQNVLLLKQSKVYD
jgi:hypothetical protein